MTEHRERRERRRKQRPVEIEETIDSRLDHRLDAGALAAIAEAENEAPDREDFGLHVAAPTGEMAIRASNLGIRYNLNFTKKTKLRTTFANLLDPRRRRKGHFWALRGVDFTVNRGEAVGIVGPNGSGKSTMLLALAGIIQPSEGVVEVNGHVSTLLSLQAGFDSELSGRENIALAGALMGIDHKVMQEITPGIIKFANIGAFIDAPMKTYSSGMRARVGFSIATAVDPDILLLDEVLQTGDNAFKQKSRQRIAEVLQTAKAVVMVTHDMSWITAFCTRAILLDKGTILAEGDPEEIADMHVQDSERRKVQKRRAKQLLKSGQVDAVDIRQARKAGKLDEVLDGSEEALADLRERKARWEPGPGQIVPLEEEVPEAVAGTAADAAAGTETGAGAAAEEPAGEAKDGAVPAKDGVAEAKKGARPKAKKTNRDKPAPDSAGSEAEKPEEAGTRRG